jgi:hypothetical protein
MWGQSVYAPGLKRWKYFAYGAVTAVVVVDQSPADADCTVCQTDISHTNSTSYFHLSADSLSKRRGLSRLRESAQQFLPVFAALSADVADLQFSAQSSQLILMRPHVDGVCLGHPGY